MTDYNTKDALNYALSGEPSKFKDAVNDILMNKVGDALNIRKMDISTNMFNEEEPEMDAAAEVEVESEVSQELETEEEADEDIS
tara:strand:+ start:433 stop:684 length:252 start_codon:yes stop_codon:yes gene_type:complete